MHDVTRLVNSFFYDSCRYQQQEYSHREREVSDYRTRYRYQDPSTRYSLSSESRAFEASQYQCPSVCHLRVRGLCFRRLLTGTRFPLLFTTTHSRVLPFYVRPATKGYRLFSVPGTTFPTAPFDNAANSNRKERVIELYVTHINTRTTSGERKQLILPIRDFEGVGKDGRVWSSGFTSCGIEGSIHVRSNNAGFVSLLHVCFPEAFP